MLLQLLADFFVGKVRDYDIVCRYGGEEFVIIMPDYTLGAAEERADILRSEIKTLAVTYDSQDFPMSTLSLSVAAFPTHGDTCDQILRAADQALYQAKHGGRDQVMIASPIQNLSDTKQG